MSSSVFLSSHSEKLKLNQYWYSAATIDAMVAEIESVAIRCAFLSTPSIFFSLSNKQLQHNSKLLDYDETWSDHPGFVKYDFHKPDDLPASLHHSFDYVVIDPPFITDDVWTLYARTALLLLTPAGSSTPPRLLLSTIPENADMMRDVLGVSLVRFRPSIPNLIYQYSFFTNYYSDRLDSFNAEIDSAEWSEEHSARKKTAMESYSSDQMRDETEAKKMISTRLVN